LLIFQPLGDAPAALDLEVKDWIKRLIGNEQRRTQGKHDNQNAVAAVGPI
jgi:hypothetical protein